MLKFIGYLLLLIPFKLYFRVKVKGLENIPNKGSCLFLSNHVSMIDPPFIGVAAYWKKKTKFLARDTLFNNPVMGFLLRSFGCIPLNRGAGFRSGFENAFSGLKKEDIAVVAFPEGTRSPDGKTQMGKPGIGLFILEANVPIVPCFITGAHEALPKGKRLPRPKRITITFGKPFQIPPVSGREANKEDYRRIVAEVMAKIIEVENNI